MREIVTVQIGSFANYVGSHFWNFQDELLGLADDPHGDPLYRHHCLNMDVLYRSGEHQGIPTYTPRLLSIGTKGSLGSLCSSLFSAKPSTDDSEVITWKGKISREVARPLKKNLFLERLHEEDQEKPPSSDSHLTDGYEKEIQDKDIVESLETDVYYWTDFSKVQYQPQSLFELHTSWVDIEEFENYGSGNGVASSGLQGEELHDRLRYFIEECDHIQGIQFIVDDSGGFSSVAADFMETIADDYCKTPVLLYTPRSPASFVYANNQKQSRALHDAVSFSQLATSCQLIVPVGLPSFSTSKLSDFLCINDAKLFHSSGIYAAALNCISLPFRMDLHGPTANPTYTSGAISMGELVQMITGHGWENMVAILDASLPFPSLDANSLEYIQKSFHPLNHEVVDDDADDAEDLQAVEAVVTQGALQTAGLRASILDVKNAIYGVYQNGLPRPRFSHFTSTLCPLPIPLSFPSIFRNLVGKQGEILANPCNNLPSKGPLEVESVPMGSRLRSSRAILPFVKKRFNDLHRFGIQRGAPGGQLLRSWGFSKDEVEEMRETLFKMVRTLDPQPEISSDSD